MPGHDESDSIQIMIYIAAASCCFLCEEVVLLISSKPSRILPYRWHSKLCHQSLMSILSHQVRLSVTCFKKVRSAATVYANLSGPGTAEINSALHALLAGLSLYTTTNHTSIGKLALGLKGSSSSAQRREHCSQSRQ